MSQFQKLLPSRATFYSEKKNREKEQISYVRHADCARCICYRMLAPLQIKQNEQKKTNFKNFQSALFNIFGKFNTDGKCRCIVACTRKRFCRRP